MLVLDDEGYGNNLGNGASEVFQILTEFLFLLLQGMVSHFEIRKENVRQRKESKPFRHTLSVQSHRCDKGPERLLT